MSPTAPRSAFSAEQLNAVDRMIASGQLEKAAEALNFMAVTAPADPRPYLLGIRLGEACNNPKTALESARTAAQLAPSWSIAVSELAFLLARLNHAEEAMQQARQAVALAPADTQLLARMTDVAHMARDFETAVEWLRRVDQLAPGQAPVLRLIARDLHVLGRHRESVAAWGQALALDEKDRESLMGRMQAAFVLMDQAQAVRDCETLLALEPGNEEYRFWHAVAQGRTPPSQPDSAVRSLFDGFADVFHQHIVERLKYQLPREVAQKIFERHPDRKLDLLDLGCGTGLLGEHLGRIDGSLVGVDISPRMLDEARRLNVYDRLDAAGLTQALVAEPDASYDVVAALEVFVYLGELGATFPQVMRVLRPGGALIFSCESASPGEGDLLLRPSLRYAHSQERVEAQCHAAGFADLAVERKVLREENGAPVHGFVVLALKP
ncbi:MAG TPA: methyltransferase [Ramlibacter sp.]|nr:methyltransferase [Ramlibacter sp.]